MYFFPLISTSLLRFKQNISGREHHFVAEPLTWNIYSFWMELPEKKKSVSKLEIGPVKLFL